MVSFEPLYRRLALMDIPLYTVVPRGIFSLTKSYQVEYLCSKLGCSIGEIMEIVSDDVIPGYIRYRQKISFCPLFSYLDSMGYTKREVSLYLGKTGNYISNLTAKGYKPPYEHFVRLALALKANPSSLFEVIND